MEIHSSTFVWKIPWTEEPGRPQSMGSQRVGHEYIYLGPKCALPHPKKVGWRGGQFTAAILFLF